MKNFLASILMLAFMGFAFTPKGISCDVPGDLQIHHTSTTAATLSWDAVAGASVQYIWRYRLGAFSWVTSSATSLTYGGVASLSTSQYEFQVSSVCAGVQSAFSPSFFFRGLGSSCGSDSWETNNGSSNCPTVWAGETVNARSTSAGDLEYFRVLASGSCLDILLSGLPAGTNYDMKLYSLSGGFLTEIGSSSNSGTTNEVITLNSLTDGDNYFVRIVLSSGSSSSCFTLTYDNTCFMKGGGLVNRSDEGSNSDVDVETNTVTVSPNPASDLLTVSLNLPKEEAVQIKLVNMVGAVIETRQVASSNRSEVQFSLANVPAGIYTLHIKGANWERMEKVLVSR